MTQLEKRNWTEFPQQSEIKVIGAKLVPLSFRPLGSLMSFRCVYDPDSQRHVTPLPDEDPKHLRELFVCYAMDEGQYVRAFIFPKTVAQQIGALLTKMGTDTRKPASPYFRVDWTGRAYTVQVDEQLDGFYDPQRGKPAHLKTLDQYVQEYLAQPESPKRETVVADELPF
jgi:hypothetical protein